ncbi:pre-mRNA processing factor 8 [Perkinsela sp. CCAP 1560/4]|nr:pre-mRNA processing factor 8 [Perkinsela sp. CCAP 1560/4]|eukprot:KNH09319.1 pre-mRNA processing factor 8 [Perkinsela sp. CCAP 1560/4]
MWHAGDGNVLVLDHEPAIRIAHALHLIGFTCFESHHPAKNNHAISVAHLLRTHHFASSVQRLRIVCGAPPVPLPAFLPLRIKHAIWSPGEPKQLFERRVPGFPFDALQLLDETSDCRTGELPSVTASLQPRHEFYLVQNLSFTTVNLL